MMVEISPIMPVIIGVVVVIGFAVALRYWRHQKTNRSEISSQEIKNRQAEVLAAHEIRNKHMTDTVFDIMKGKK